MRGFAGSIVLDRVRGPGGWYRIAVSERGLLRCALPGRRQSKRAFERETRGWLAQRGNPDARRQDPERLRLVFRELIAGWDGDAAWHCFQFPPALDLRGSAFRVQVWRTLCRVPPGEVVSYGDLAERAGSPRAARAVGTAMRENPCALFVPCHRVVAANGPGQFGSAGLGLKLELLALEGYEAWKDGE